MWSADQLADAALAALLEREEQLRREQAVHGLDADTELSLHPLLANAMAAAGFGVLREQPYPHEWKRKRKGPDLPADDSDLPVHRDRQRCDLVLTPEVGQRLDDELVVVRASKRAKKQAVGTLFEAVALNAPAEAKEEELLRSRSGLVQPEDAFWLEIKLVSQFDFSSGVPGPNQTYSSQLLRGPVTDLMKLAEDPRVGHAGVLLVLFTDTQATAQHDLPILIHRCLDKELPIGSPAVRSMPIVDRVGNAWCTLCLLSMRRLDLGT